MIPRRAAGLARRLKERKLAHWGADVARELAPDQLWPGLTEVLVTWSEHGPNAETAEILETLPEGSHWVVWARYWQALQSDRYEDALAVLSASGLEWIHTKMWAGPVPLFEAWPYRAMGRPGEAATRLARARSLLEAALAEHPDDPRYHAALGLTLAGLGERELAVAAGEKAVAILPLSRDAVGGIPFLFDLAVTHALLGDEATALEVIRTLLDAPASFTVTLLEHDPRLDQLTASPAFAGLRP